MKTYSVLFAEDVPHYGVAEIEAADDAAAIEAAKAYELSEVTNDPAWEYSVCKRIVTIHDGEGNLVAEEMNLDDCFLRYGGEKERRLCDAAGEMLTFLSDDNLGKTHRQLSELLEDCDAGNDGIREAAIDLCAALNAYDEHRKSIIARAKGEQP